MRGTRRRLQCRCQTSVLDYRQDFNKTWYQYAISMRPVVPAPDEPMHRLRSAPSPFLGTASGSGRYPKAQLRKWWLRRLKPRQLYTLEDADGKQLGTSPTLNLELDGDRRSSQCLSKLATALHLWPGDICGAAYSARQPVAVPICRAR